MKHVQHISIWSIRWFRVLCSSCSCCCHSCCFRYSCLQHIYLFMFISIFSDIRNRLEGRKQGWTNAHTSHWSSRYVPICWNVPSGWITFGKRILTQFFVKCQSQNLGPLQPQSLLGSCWEGFGIAAWSTKDSKHKWHAYPRERVWDMAASPPFSGCESVFFSNMYNCFLLKSFLRRSFDTSSEKQKSQEGFKDISQHKTPF